MTTAFRMSDLEYFDSQGDSIGAPDVSGNEGCTKVGLGGSFLIVRRISILTPTGDYYIETSLTGFWGDQNCGLISFDGRKYWDLRKNTKHVIAIQGKVQGLGTFTQTWATSGSVTQNIPVALGNV